MARRAITTQELHSLADLINLNMGYAPDEVGAVKLYGAYGGFGVVQLVNESGGRTTLLECVTKRETYYFLRGMLSAVRKLSNA